MSTLPISIASFSSSSISPVYDESSKKQHFARNTTTFNASIWGDQFLTYDEKEDFVVEKQLVEEFKGEMRKELMMRASQPMQYGKLIKVIDAIQRLGLAYLFDMEIEEALQRIYATYGNDWIDSENLESSSLWFRLLRQQGFNVSSGIFKNHMDEMGKFKETLCYDVHGMLALYEAAYMRVEGEQVLDEALEFTKTCLAITANDPSCDFLSRTEIQEALQQPLRKFLPRLEAVRYIPIYQQLPTHNEVLLKLAKLDFNILQSMHKKELSQLCKWWKDLDLQNKLPHVRDRFIEAYFWILAIYFEPENSRTRMFLVKSCIWLVVLDDTFDNYGTYEELEIFTQAVERWSISCLDMLPEYMKLIYQELLIHHQEMEESLEKEGKTYQLHHVIEMVKRYTRSIFMEAKWLKEGYMPTLEEYLSNALVSVGQALMLARSYVGRSDMVTEETFKWVASNPPLIKASCLIFRLMDDIAGHEVIFPLSLTSAPRASTITSVAAFAASEPLYFATTMIIARLSRFVSFFFSLFNQNICAGFVCRNRRLLCCHLLFLSWELTNHCQISRPRCVARGKYLVIYNKTLDFKV